MTDTATAGPALASTAPATILKHCRCMDCRQWDDGQGCCHVLAFRRYVPREEYRPAMRPFWTDVGMIRPEAWHYCACYHGPQISKDVWVWSRH